MKGFEVLGRSVRISGVLLMGLLGCHPAPTPPVFLWHSVGEGSPNDRYDLTAAEFDAQLTLLERHGATPVTFDDLWDARAGLRPLPAHAVVLTFDDGRACLFSQALPLLLKHRMKAEAFVVSSFLGEDEAHRHANQDDGGRHPFLLWSELAQMVESGAIIAESHSATHPRLPDLGTLAQRKEMEDSAHELRARLRAPIHFFAYPFGSSNEWTRLILATTDYRGGISVGKRWSDRWALPRTSIQRGATDLFERTLTDAFGPVRAAPPPGRK